MSLRIYHLLVFPISPSEFHGINTHLSPNFLYLLSHNTCTSLSFSSKLTLLKMFLNLQITVGHVLGVYKQTSNIELQLFYSHIWRKYVFKCLILTSFNSGINYIKYYTIVENITVFQNFNVSNMFLLISIGK